jgi:transcriptional regulator with XRE-family HTH domain
MTHGWNLATKRRSLALMAYTPEPISKDEVGRRLRLTREALGHEQAKLCRLMDVPANRWNNAETGDNYPSVPDMTRFCQVTGATTDWILRGVRHTLPASLLEAIQERENELAGPSTGRPAQNPAA